MKNIKRTLALAVAGVFLIGSAVSFSANADTVVDLPAGALLSEWRVASDVAAATGDNTPRVPEGLWAYRTNFQVGRTDYQYLQWTDRPIAGAAEGPEYAFFVFTAAPAFLIGADWLQIPNNARSGVGTPRAEQYVVTAAQAVTVYIGIDHRSSVWAGAVTDGANPVRPAAMGTLQTGGPANAEFGWLADWTMLPLSYYVVNNERHGNLQGRTDMINLDRPVYDDDVTPPSRFYLWSKELAAGESATIPSIGQGTNGNITMWIVAAGDAPVGDIPTQDVVGDEPKPDEDPPVVAGDTTTVLLALGAGALIAVLFVIRKRKTA